METVNTLTEKMLEFIEELQHYKQEQPATNDQETANQYNLYILQLLSYIDNINEQITLQAYHLEEADGTPEPTTINIPTPVNLPTPVITVPEITQKKTTLIKITPKEKKDYLQALGLNTKEVKTHLKKKQLNTIEQAYTLYQENHYGKLANTFCKKIAISMSKKHYHLLRQYILQADINMLSTTYISSMFFTTFILLIAGFATGFTYYALQGNIINSILLGTALGLAAALLTYAIMYNAPLLIAQGRRRAIKNDLPFVIIHMAAIAGSGAQPIAMFHLVQATGEYQGIAPEIKKVLNYVNLFGYSLTSALRAVSITTPNKEFKDLLNGITSVIESGGDIKNYLKGKAEDAFNNYQQERKKYIETLSTYSDIYIGVLLAAPLLFIVTLTIINLLGGTIGGFDVGTLAFIGTYAGIPVLNIIFILFLNIIQLD
ncbi:MAG TPA: type II secretion system F family protein [Candidatus Nanoarchaeia archaeon]|nr:type II secretion system F family protein [Candidatus Nanoarchaeia archaeon]